MPFAGTSAVTEIWSKCKAWFGRKVTASRTATTVSIQLKNEANDSLGSAASLSAADSTNAGVMTADMYTKLDGIDSGANNYTHPSYTARTGKPTANQTPAFGESFTVSQIKSDSTGHITDATDRTVTIPNATATPSSDGSGGSAGLMSALDKEKLNSVSSGAEVNQNAFSTVQVGEGSGKVDVVADSKTDTITLISGSNVTITGDSTNDKVTIAATDTKDLPSMTGTLGLSQGGTNATSAASARTNLDVYSKTEVDGLITTGAAFHGTLGTSGADYTEAQLEASSYKAGWYWVVKTAGTFVGQTCEAGDMVYTVKTKASSYSASDFSVVQNNLVEMTAAEVDAICV